MHARTKSVPNVVNPMKKTASILFVMTISFIIISGCTQTSSPPTTAPVSGTTAPAVASPGYTDRTPAEAQDLIAAEKDLVIIDVSPIYAQGHLPGAINIAVDTLDAKIPALDKTKPCRVYCHSDSVSIAGAQKLVQSGFPRVYRLKGNYEAWIAAGYPVSKE
jgi:rhodanese-related sulfurtransferase